MSKRNSYILFLLLALLIFYNILGVFYYGSFSKEFLVISLMFVFISTLAFSLKKEYASVFMKKNTFTITLLFLVGFIIVHFQVYLEYLLGNVSDLGLTYRLDYDIVPKAIAISVIALLSFYIGYMIKMIKQENMPINISTESSPTIISTSFLEGLAIVCLLIFYLSIDRSYFHGGHVLMKNNGGIGPITSYSQMILNYCIICTIILKGWSFYNQNTEKRSLIIFLRQFNWVFLATVAVYCVLVLLSGNRGPVIKIAIVAFASFVFSVKYPISKIQFLLFFSVAAIALFLLGIFRSTYNISDTSTRLEAVSILADTQISSSWLCPVTKEFAMIVRTYNSLVMFVEEYGINYGLGLFYNMLGIIPGLGFIFTSIIGIPQQSIVSAEIATTYMGSDHGMGTTCIADVYLGLGPLGIVPVFLLFGYFLRFLDYQAGGNSKISLLSWVSVIIVTAFAITIGRGTLTILFREISFTFIAIVLTQFVNSIFLPYGKNIAVNSDV